MSKLSKVVFVISSIMLLNACNQKPVALDCSNQVAQALKDAQHKKKSVRKQKTPEEKLAQKDKRIKAKEAGVDLRLEKSKFSELNLTQAQKDAINQAKSLLDESVLELTKKSKDSQQLLNDALRAGDSEAIRQVLNENEKTTQSQRNKELEYTLSVYSQLTLDQMTLIADNSRLNKLLLGLKSSGKNSRGNKKGSHNRKNKRKHKGKSKSEGS